LAKGFVGIVIVASCASAILSSSASRTASHAAGEPARSAASPARAKPASATPANAPRPEVPDLEVSDVKWGSGEFGTKHIEGIVRNNTDHHYSYVQVEINLYDGSGVQVGSTLANVNNLEPGSKWRFEAPVLSDNASSARVKNVQGF
jgi:hypothetical protein